MATSYYSTGTVSLTNGSPVVTGIGTGWQLALISGGNVIVQAQGNVLPIASVDSDSQITSELVWTGDDGEYSYTIQRDTAYLQSLDQNSQNLSYLLSELRAGTIFKYDQSGDLAGRDLYDARPKNFGYLVTIGVVSPVFYVKASDTEGDWAGPFPYGRGAQGEKGDTGDPGPYTSVDVGEVTTLPAGSAATVTAVPVESGTIELDFGIPRGFDGDGAGDMIQAVYDPTNKQADTFDRSNHTGTQTIGSIDPFELTPAPALRTIAARFWDKPSVRDWNAVGNNSTEDDAAIQAAGAYCAANRMALYIPAGDYVVGSTIDITDGFPILGDGPIASRIIPRNFNGPAFRYVTSGKEINNFVMKDLEILFDFPDPEAPYTNSAAIQFAGDNNFVQEGTFKDVLIRGPRFAFQSIKPPHTTSFGQEGTVAWITYDGIQVHDHQRQVEVGWNFQAGSGTGNLWQNIRSRMYHSSGYVWRFDGSGCVVGDILISDSNLLGPANGFLGGDNTVYRRNIRISGCQFDASMINPIVFSTVGAVEWSDYDIADNNYGGGTSVANLPLSHSARYSGNEVGRLEDGKRIAIEDTGFQTQAAYRVWLKEYTGCVIEFSIAGLVGGVGGGISRIVVIASRQTGAPVILGVDQHRTPDAAGYPQLSITANASGYVELGFTCTPSSGNTRLNAQVLVRNGTARIEQL